MMPDTMDCQYGDVVLTRDVRGCGLRAGDIGTVVERHVVSGVAEDGYAVEFFDMTGNTVAVIALPASALRLPTAGDRPTARAVGHPVADLIPAGEDGARNAGRVTRR